MTNSHSKIATNKDSWYMQDPDDENVALIPLSNRSGQYAKVDMNLIEEIGKHSKHWWTDHRGYARAKSRVFGMSKIRLHQLVVYLVYSGFLSNGDCDIDHINREKLDCSSDNLRLCTHRENMMNTGRDSKASRYPGVSKNKQGYWTAQIKIDRKQIYLGRSQDEHVAARMYRDTVRTIDPQVDHPSWNELDGDRVVIINSTVHFNGRN